MTLCRLALLSLLLSAGCGGDASQGRAPPKPTSTPLPSALAGMWVADPNAVRETVMRILRERADLASVAPDQRAAARETLAAKVEAFVAKWSMQLTLRVDGTFVYRLTQPGAPTVLRAGSVTRDGTLLTLQVEETRNDAGKVVEDPWPPGLLTHDVRWEDKRLRFRALGRDTFEFLLYRE